MPQPYSFPPSPSDGAALGAAALLAKFDSDPAKRESIPHHTENALFIYKVIRERYDRILNATEDFWQQLWVALLFHDAGKFVLNFQSENKKAQEANRKRTNWDTHIRHEFISCLLFMYDYEKLFGLEPFAFLAVAAHHKPLDQELYSRDAEKTLEYEDEDLRAIVIYLADRLQRLGITWDLSPIAQGKLEKARSEKSLSNAYKLVRRQIDNHLNFHRGHQVQSWVPARHRYAEFLGLLHTCDWLASAHKFPDPPLYFTPDQLLSELKAKEEASGSGKLVAWRKFQEDSVLVGNVLAIAPTGSGKTEASLLWASQKEASSKLIYCLPTRVTSNAIFQRMRKFFPSDGAIDHVGVVHSGAKDYRILSEKDERAADNYLTDRSFFRNVTVCTIDQLLTTGFNLGHWHLKLLHLRNASIVIDEIHLYAPYTLGLIIATIQYLQKYCQCRFYVMTATMPDKLKSLLATTLGSEVSIVEDVEKLGQARNTWRIDSRNFKDESLLEQIKQDIAAKKKVLVVRNTVDSCVETFEALVPAGQRLLPANTLQQTAMCLHARFTQHDRLAKEAIVVSPNLSSPYLLVSTQVIEVSLDIDFDVMYTENAPIDSLVQRAGRVNRKGNKGDST